MVSQLSGLHNLSASISCTRRSYGWFSRGLTGSTARQSPEISQFKKANCCNSQKLSIRAMSQSVLSAQIFHSRSICFSSVLLSSGDMPSNSASMLGFKRSPRPTMLVRMVLTAPFAIGTPIYKSRVRCRSIETLSSMSSRLLPPA